MPDDDGSESYTMRIVDNLPAGTELYGNGVQLLPSGGFYYLDEVEVNSLYVKAPLHWSSINPSQGK